jgi:hypothetical protein
MSWTDVAVLLHLAGAIAFFSGMAVAAAAQLAGSRRTVPGEVAAALSVARTGVALVGAGFVVLVASGPWLLELTPASAGDGWVAASGALLLAAAVLGAVGGRAPKRARLLAEAGEDSRALLRDRRSLAANAAAAAAMVAILVLMVWQP